jgi:hypothetical protein
LFPRRSYRLREKYFLFIGIGEYFFGAPLSSKYIRLIGPSPYRKRIAANGSMLAICVAIAAEDHPVRGEIMKTKSGPYEKTCKCLFTSIYYFYYIPAIGKVKHARVYVLIYIGNVAKCLADVNVRLFNNINSRSNLVD